MASDSRPLNSWWTWRKRTRSFIHSSFNDHGRCRCLFAFHFIHKILLENKIKQKFSKSIRSSNTVHRIASLSMSAEAHFKKHERIVSERFNHTGGQGGF